MPVLYITLNFVLTVEDIHTDDNSFVFVDEDSNDCKLLSIKKKEKVVRYAYHRDFDTCDPHDYVIEV